MTLKNILDKAKESKHKTVAPVQKEKERGSDIWTEIQNFFTPFKCNN